MHDILSIHRMSSGFLVARGRLFFRSGLMLPFQYEEVLCLPL
jgi:hypothetical protein